MTSPGTPLKSLVVACVCLCFTMNSAGPVSSSARTSSSARPALANTTVSGTGYPAAKSCLTRVFTMNRASDTVPFPRARGRRAQRGQLSRTRRSAGPDTPLASLVEARVCMCFTMNSASDTVPLRRCMCFKMKTENRCGGYIVRWRFAEMHDFRARTCAYSEC